MFALSCWPNSLTLIGSSRFALTAVRRKLATETPGIVAGYWKAMNRPARLRQLGERDVLERPDDRALDARPQQLRRAGRALGLDLAGADEAAVGAGADALDRGDRALQRLDDLRHRDRLRGPRQPVAAVGA